MPRPISPRWRALAAGSASIAAFVLLWRLASMREATILFPGPLATIHAAVVLLREGVLSQDVLISLMRIGVGFVAGVAVGVPLGLAMGAFRPIRIVFEPYILSFPKNPSVGIRTVRQNQRIIRRDACHPPPAWKVCPQSVQVTASA
jgi:ABC-type nitrate/sulfonate/bicarbonate transport system permease component